MNASNSAPSAHYVARVSVGGRTLYESIATELGGGLAEFRIMAQCAKAITGARATLSGSHARRSDYTWSPLEKILSTSPTA